jgi:phosphoglucosamine mutase
LTPLTITKFRLSRKKSIMKKLFGTDGIRGEAGIFPLDAATIYTIGQSLARQYAEKSGRKPRFITGRDTRESGSWIEKAFHDGVHAAGGEAISAEIITTPGVAFLTKQFEFDAGVVISASHNPFHDNGLKVFLPSGKKIDETIEREIEKDIFKRRESEVESRESGEVDNSRTDEFQNAYLNYLAESFSSLSLKGFRIVLDCANGASSNLAPRLFEKFGAEVIAIHNLPDGKNINANCGSTHIQNLQAKVIADKANFGVAFDGDADRSLFVDEHGKFVDGDITLWAMAQHLQSHNKLNNNTVVATVMSNIGLEIALKSKNINLLRTDVGDKYVLQSLIETNSSVGGEQSGHIIFPNRSLVGDGMFTALSLLETLSETGKSLSEISRGFESFPQILVNVEVAEKRPFEEVAEIMEAANQIETELGAKGRLLLRYSGTENLARVMIEGENQADVEQRANRLAEVIKTALSK